MEPNFVFKYLAEVLHSFVSANQSVFVPTGRNIFHAVAVTMLVWFGIQSALSGAPDFARFARLLMLIAFGKALTTFYSTPIPGIGYSLIGLVTEQSYEMSKAIGWASAQEVTKGVATAYEKLGAPVASVLNPLQVVHYYAIKTMLLLTEAATIFIVGYSHIATSIIIVLGPVFVPWLIVPKLDFLFWGWLRSLLIYSFMQVVSAAMVLVLGRLLVATLNAMLPGPYLTPSLWFRELPALYVLQFVYLFAIFKIPSLTNHIFSGSGGGSAGVGETVAFASRMLR